MKRYSATQSLDRWGRLDGSRVEKPQYLGFSVGAFQLGIPLLRLSEVRGLHGIVPIMLPPDYRSGRAIVCGHTVPLLDLRVELECPASYDDQTRLILAWYRVDEVTESKVGLIVDAVENVLDVDELKLKSPTDEDVATYAAYALGVVDEGKYRRLLLDLDRWLVD